MIARASEASGSLLPPRGGRPVKGGRVREFNPHRIKHDPNNPRKTFPRIPQLAQSIKAMGQRAAGEVTLIENDPDFDAMLVSGERRVRACRLAGVPFEARVSRKKMSPSERMINALGVNFHQEPHNHLEIAYALRDLQEMRVKEEKKPLTQKEIGRVFGKSDFWVSTHLSLFKLSEKIHDMMVLPDVTLEGVGAVPVTIRGNEETRAVARVTSGRRAKPYYISYATALLLTSVDDKPTQERLAEHIYKDEMSKTRARRYILKETNKEGVSHGLRIASPAEASETFGNKLQTIQDFLGVYGDSTDEKLKHIFASSEPSELRADIEILAKIGKDTQRLKERVEHVLRIKVDERMAKIRTGRTNN
jgi:ParB/RepB/Spo0J family partition protein